MKLHQSMVMLLAILLVACQVQQPSSNAPSEDVVPIDHLPALSGDYFKLQSDAVGRPFHIYVRLPEGYAEDDAHYPTVYVLDGDSLFPILAANHLFLTYDEDLPEAIVVGIAYGSFDPATNRRGLDFSAPAPDAGPEQGGAADFHQFLKHELIPAVEGRYRSDSSRRVLFGQSRGGYMVLYSAFTDPDLFWGRIASNPTFGPGRDRFFSRPSPSSRDDLGLVVTSGSRDRTYLREAALEWFDSWNDRESRPWSLKTGTIEGGTHSAYSTASYREGMIWLFSREQ